MSDRPRPLPPLRPLRHPVGRDIDHLSRAPTSSCAAARSRRRNCGRSASPTRRSTSHGYVMATIPATTTKAGVPTIGFIAHVDTSPEMPAPASSRSSIAHYDGRDLVLPDDPAAVLRSAEIPALADQIGHDIVTASGTTLLGADNKAGVAEIVTAAAYLVAHPEIPHGTDPHRVHAGRGGRPRHAAFRRRAASARTAPTRWTAAAAARSRSRASRPTR